MSEVIAKVGKDAFIVDEETGEILGIADVKSDWAPETEEEVDWVLSLMLDEDTEILAAQAKLKALTENVTRMIGEHTRRRKYLEFRYGPSLEQFALKQIGDELDKAKGKRSVNRPFGTLQFRVPTASAEPKVSIKADYDTAAIKWAKANLPEAVKVEESLMLTPLKEHLDDLPLEVFDIKWPERTFSVKTGVKE